jgi:uncharacterized phage-associated protein
MNTARPFKFDAEKALEIILYISKRAPIPDIFHVCKILYFADRHHLEEYGRLVCGDDYFALPNGPVPSGTYDLIRDVQYPQRESPHAEKARETFSLNGWHIKPSREADLSFMSQSDIECLNKAIKEVGRLPFGRLKELSHDAAYHSANINGEIPIEAIASTLRDSEELIEELRDA